MSYLCTIILISINFITGICQKHKRFFAVLLLLFSWILFWGNTNNPDYYGYLLLYQSNGELGSSNIEFGYLLLIKGSNLIGLNYHAFLAIISFIALSLIHSTIKRYSDNYSYIYLLYFIFPFFLDIVQVRNFLAMAIFIYSTKYIISNSKIKYFSMILIAASIQSITIAYLPFVLITLKIKNKKTLIKVVTLISIGVSILILINNKEIPLLREIIIQIGFDKVLTYLDTKTDNGYILFWGLQFMSYIMLFLTKGVYYNSFGKFHLEDIKTKFISIVYWINVLAFIFFPLYLINSNFTRLMRNIVLLNYISFAITKDSIEDKKEKFLYIILVFVYIIIMFISQMLHYTDTIIKSVLNNNILF